MPPVARAVAVRFLVAVLGGLAMSMCLFGASAASAESDAPPASTSSPVPADQVGQTLTIEVPPHEMPSTTLPAPESGGVSIPRVGSPTSGLLPRTGLDPRLTIVGLLLVAVGWFLRSWGRNHEPGRPTEHGTVG